MTRPICSIPIRVLNEKMFNKLSGNTTNGITRRAFLSEFERMSVPIRRGYLQRMNHCLGSRASTKDTLNIEEIFDHFSSKQSESMLHDEYLEMMKLLSFDELVRIALEMDIDISMDEEVELDDDVHISPKSSVKTIALSSDSRMEYEAFIQFMQSEKQQIPGFHIGASRSPQPLRMHRPWDCSMKKSNFWSNGKHKEDEPDSEMMPANGTMISLHYDMDCDSDHCSSPLRWFMAKNRPKKYLTMNQNGSN